MDFVVGLAFDFMGYVGAPVLWITVGMLVAWNVLAQPAFVKTSFDYVVTTVKGWFAKK